MWVVEFVWLSHSPFFPRMVTFEVNLRLFFFWIIASVPISGKWPNCQALNKCALSVFEGGEGPRFAI